MPTDALPLATRIWFAWLCLFKVIFDARFAARAWDARTAAGRGSSLPAGHEPDRLEAPIARAASPTSSPPSDSPKPSGARPPAVAGLQLLTLLQREGRLVDFLQQDIASFSDADVGVAARVVHEGCRRVLRAHAAVEPVRSEAEGARVMLAAGFDADAVKLVGDVKGGPPFSGVLRHRGWRASKLDLPELVGEHDERIVAPAEVEIG